jgi:tetratricopeptide (TPR) repeat protein
MRHHLSLRICFTASFALSAGCSSVRPVEGVTEMQGKTAGDETDGWHHYDEGNRLVDGGHAGEAASEYRRAEDAFGDKYLVERSMAIYARARALDLAGRCTEAYDAYREYADFVQVSDPRSAYAAISVAETCRQIPTDDTALTGVVVALRSREYARALALVERIQPSSRLSDAWCNYDRGAALAGLHRTDEAIGAFETAEQRFAEAGEGVRGRPLVEWSKARVLSEAGRCDDARRTYGAFARMIRDSDPKSADMAVGAARNCTVLESSR